MYKKLTKSNQKMIFGVCGGLAEYFEVDPTLIRIIWVISLFVSFGAGLIPYIIMAIIVPNKPI